MRLGALLRYVWAAPASTLGLIVALTARVAGARLRVVEGVLEAAGPCISAAVGRLPRAMRFNAITFGHVIIGLDDEALAVCRAHEHVHVRQYERWGILFFALYLGASLVALLRRRNPYWDNYFERQAYGRTGPGSQRPRRDSPGEGSSKL